MVLAVRSSSIAPRLAVEVHALDAVRCSPGSRVSLTSTLSCCSQPGGEQDRGRRTPRTPCTSTAVTAFVRRLVQDRRQLGPPEGQPGPGEVGVAGAVGLAEDP